MVKLRWAKGGHPQTGLNRPSAAICDWRNKDVNKDDITSYEKGTIYGETLIEIMAKVEKFSETNDAEESTQS